MFTTEIHLSVVRILAPFNWSIPTISLDLRIGFVNFYLLSTSAPSRLCLCKVEIPGYQLSFVLIRGPRLRILPCPVFVHEWRLVCPVIFVCDGSTDLVNLTGARDCLTLKQRTMMRFHGNHIVDSRLYSSPETYFAALFSLEVVYSLVLSRRKNNLLYRR